MVTYVVTGSWWRGGGASLVTVTVSRRRRRDGCRLLGAGRRRRFGVRRFRRAGGAGRIRLAGAVAHARQGDRHASDGDQRDRGGQPDHQLRQPLPRARLLDRRRSAARTAPADASKWLLRHKVFVRVLTGVRDGLVGDVVVLRPRQRAERLRCRRVDTGALRAARPVAASATTGAIPVCGLGRRTVCREQRRTHRRVQSGLRCRHHRGARVLRKALCDQRNARAATHRDHGGDVGPANPLRSNVFSRASRRPPSGAAISDSNSVRVN